MGVSANQARLMTLTARLHDLELRAQQISAQKMIVSMGTQSAATAYSTALKNYSEKKANVPDTYVGNVADPYYIDEYGDKIDLNMTWDDYCDIDLNSAKYKYETTISNLSSQEKLLDLELTQINTEHTAVNTEYDSIKSLISDNVDKSFNVFG